MKTKGLLLFVISLSFAAATAFADKTQISLWALQAHVGFLQPIADEFMKANPDIEVTLSGYGTDAIKEALKVAASSKSLPDLWFTWGGSLGSFYVENGLTMDLTPIAKKEGWSKIYNQAALDLSTFGGKISGVPFHLAVMGVFYRKSMYEKLKLSPPTTFAQFESQLNVLKSNGITPLAFGSKFGWHTMRLTEQLLEHFAGPRKHTEMNLLKASWNDPAVVKTFQLLKDWTDKGYFPKGYVSLDPTEAENLFYQGKGGLIIEGNWMDSALIAAGLDASDFDFFKFPTDQKPVRMSTFAEMFQINAQGTAEKRDAALKLARYMTSKEAVNSHIEDYGAAATLGVNGSPKSPHVIAMAEAANAGSFQITDQALPQEVVQRLFEAQDKVALGDWTPQQAAAEMQKAVEAYKAK